MKCSIVLDQRNFEFHKSFFPCLIIGANKSGASYFSISLIANLISEGFKVIFFTAFPMAKEELLNQIGTKALYEVKNEADIQMMPRDKTIIVKS